MPASMNGDQQGYRLICNDPRKIKQSGVKTDKTCLKKRRLDISNRQLVLSHSITIVLLK